MPDLRADPPRGLRALNPPRIRLASPDVGEEELEAIRQVFASGILTNGPRTAEFERAFAARHETEHAVALANGTIALVAMYTALRIGPGDEVIVPSLTFISSATSILHVGATPVFCDVDAETFNLDPIDVATRITPRTKAILAVHYGGMPAAMDELRAIAEDAGVALLEDAAEAHGASYHGQPVGGLGRAAMFSFTPTKNITTGEGGIVTTNDGDLAAELRLLRNHGQTALYEHAVLGHNWRMTEMQAAMGVVQLGKLDRIIETKRRNAEWMRDRLSGVDGVQTPVVPKGFGHVYMLYSVLVAQPRDEVLARLLEDGVEGRLYFPPAHRQPPFAGSAAKLPVTDHLADHLLSIPFHARLDGDELEEVARSLADAGGRS